MRVNGPEISKYGVIKKSDKTSQVFGVVEKPIFKEAPSNLASIGRYVLSPEIFKILKKTKPGAGDEIQLADALNVLAKDQGLESVLLKGKRFDCGHVEGFMEATIHMFKKYKKKKS